MSDVTSARRAASAAQAILQETDKTLIVDGRFGSHTMKVFEASSPALKGAVNGVVRSLGFTGGVNSLRGQFAAKASSVPDGGNFFDTKVIPSLVRAARERGVNPAFGIAQLVLESGGGVSTPLGDDGQPSLNYAGLKWNSVVPHTRRKATAKTGEVIAGKRVTQIAEFAAFDTADEFAVAYFRYLYSGPSSYRYKGLDKATTALQFGNILQQGGYATDPKYGEKLASVATRVSIKYALA